MRKLKVMLVSSMLLLCSNFTWAQRYSNEKYDVKVARSGEMSISYKGNKKSNVLFKPEFTLVYLEKETPHSMERIIRDEVNGVDNVIYRTFSWGKEQDLFKIGEQMPVVLDEVTFLPEGVEYRFKKSKYGQLEAKFILADGMEDPAIEFTYEVSKPGCHSIGYCGAPEIKPQQCDEIWQPMVWTQKRFPGTSYLTPSYLCAMPMTAVESKGRSYAVVADPDSFPFQPLPTFLTSGFGVTLRNQKGMAQPSLWAPIIGTPQSVFKKGDRYSFKIRLVINSGKMTDLHEDVAMNLYGLRTYHRDNQIGVNLNTTLDNMIDYGMSQYSWYIKELKGYSYEQDVKTAVKNVSSLNFLNFSVVTDNESIYNERFMPICEFMLSREDLLFALNPEYRGPGRQNADNRLGNPCAKVVDAAALYECTGKQNDFLINPEVIAGGKLELERYPEGWIPSNIYAWRNQFAKYRATGDEHYLDSTCSATDQYIEDVVDHIQQTFDYKDERVAGTWPALAPRFPELYRLWTETHNPRYLEAARIGARRYAQFIMMCPSIPDGKVTVNIGGRAPRQKNYGDNMRLPEEEVDCWRLSEIGLTAEGTGTSNNHRVVFWANFAAYMLKIAHETNDDFLAKIANWAMVGRYANFPGYHINTARTTVYEKPDFPLHTFHELNVNSIHHNHIWPAMSIVLDYLISDVTVKSDGQIEFPSVSIETYVNFGVELYGHQPGRFYGNEVTLWMPQCLLSSSNPQFNYLSARQGKDKLYLAFANQSLNREKGIITLNPELVHIGDGSKISILSGAQKGKVLPVTNSSFDVVVDGEGITSVCIENAHLNVSFQDKILTTSGKWDKDFYRNDYGRGMILNFGGMAPHFFTYIDGIPGMYKRVGISYSIDGKKWKDQLDCVFPFEFSVDLPENARRIEYKYIIVDKDNNTIRTPVAVLEK